MDEINRPDELNPDFDIGESSPEPAPAFQPRLGTYILLFFMLVIWPGASLSFMFMDTNQIDWNLLDPVYFIYLPTIIIQWLIFIAVALGIYREKSSFRSLGFVRFRLKDIWYALGFLIISNLLLTGLQLLLSLLGLTISQDVDFLVEKAGESAWWWLAVSATAAICEETAFRGYILTRVKGIYRKGGWLVPVLLSSLSFASGHSYQGAAGLILLFIYGLLFCGLYLFSKSLWPCVLAHFIQDFSAIYLYGYINQ